MKKYLVALLALLCASQAWAFNTSVTFKPTVQVAAYVAGNSLGGLQTVPAFIANSQYNGILYGANVVNTNGATTAITVYIFDTLPTATTCTDKTAFALGAVDVAKLAVAPFVLTPAAPVGTTNTIAQLLMIVSMRNKDVTTRTNNLYVCVLANAGVTPATTGDYTFRLLGDM